MAPLEVYWLVYLCVIEVMTIALIDSSLTRRFDNRRMVLSWFLIAIVPVVITLALQHVPPFFSEFWPNRYVPRAGVPLLFLPLFPAIGSLLLYDDKRTSKISPFQTGSSRKKNVVICSIQFHKSLHFIPIHSDDGKCGIYLIYFFCFFKYL